MTDTPRLALPVIEAAQAQKHVTHNEALTLLDALTQLAVEARTLSAPPSSPAEGSCYIPAAGCDRRLERLGRSNRSLQRWRLDAHDAGLGTQGLGEGRAAHRYLRRRHLARRDRAHRHTAAA